MTALLRPIAFVGVAYLIYIAGFLFFLPNIIYPFTKTGQPPQTLERTEVRVLPATPFDPEIEVWITEPLPGRPVILYFMGFGGALWVHEDRIRSFVDAGFGVAAMSYRGGGGQPGLPREQHLLRDAFRLYDGLDAIFGRAIDPEDRIIYGFSLGSGLAVPLARAREEMALVLEAPFDQMCRIIDARVPLLPACGFMWTELYDNTRWIGGVGTTVYFLHGGNDAIVPLEHGALLFRLASQPKFARIYDDGGHEDLNLFRADTHTIRFLDTLRGLP
ncbi:MAG: hypothetical protein AAGA32_09905 [Pseudomonadota bacterium]